MAAAARGRPPTIDAATVSLVALRLFTERGFDAVSMDDIARQAGVGRRSLFRLFPSKASLVWGGFDAFVERIRTILATLPDHLSGDEAVCTALVGAAEFPPDEIDVTRRRLLVIRDTPSIAGDGAPQEREVTAVLAAALASRDGRGAGELQVVTRAAGRVAEATTALAWWAEHDGGSPSAVVARALGVRDAHES